MRCVITRGVTGLLLVLTLAACSGGGDKPVVVGSPVETRATTRPVPSLPTATTTFPDPASTSSTAANGQNYSACKDGTCEVLIRKKATFIVRGDRLTITIANSMARIDQSGPTGSGSMVLPVGSGGGSWSVSGGPTTSIALRTADGTSGIIVLVTH